MAKSIRHNSEETETGPVIDELRAVPSIVWMLRTFLIGQTFVADGVSRIWDRIEGIIKSAGLDEVPTHQVLDNCRASHHFNLSLKALGLSDTERTPLYLEHRTLLRNGQWRRVVEEWQEVAYGDEADPTPNELFGREINDLTKHGEAGRLKCPKFRSLGVSLDSGAIESSVRRVINMRLKGNGNFWLHEKAEIMLQLRCHVISKRWHERVTACRKRLRYKSDLRYSWDYRSMSCKTECANEIPKPPLKTVT